MIRVTKKMDGSCPYCFGTTFSFIKDRTPMLAVNQCQTCNKFLVKNKTSAVSYPIDNPLNQDSPAYK